VAILEELREAGSVRLLALTNWSRETFPLSRPRYPFLEWFEAIVVSGDVRLAKPDPRIFRHLLDTFELDPARTVFIDDAPANVETAASLGMVAIRFTDADALRSRLVELGLLPAVPARSPAPSAGAGATPA
jgi:2-haloacid dehalogenase